MTMPALDPGSLKPGTDRGSHRAHSERLEVSRGARWRWLRAWKRFSRSRSTRPNSCRWWVAAGWCRPCRNGNGTPDYQLPTGSSIGARSVDGSRSGKDRAARVRIDGAARRVVGDPAGGLRRVVGVRRATRRGRRFRTRITPTAPTCRRSIRLRCSAIRRMRGSARSRPGFRRCCRFRRRC